MEKEVHKGVQKMVQYELSENTIFFRFQVFGFYLRYAEEHEQLAKKNNFLSCLINFVQ